MTMPRLVIDTGALWSPSAVRNAAKVGARDLVLPAVAYTERARQLKRDGTDIRHLDRLLRELGIVVEDFGRREGLRVAAQIADDSKWRAHSRDAMIAGHVRPGDLLLTTDAADFAALGLDPAQVREIVSGTRRAPR